MNGQNTQNLNAALLHHTWTLKRRLFTLPNKEILPGFVSQNGFEYGFVEADIKTPDYDTKRLVDSLFAKRVINNRLTAIIWWFVNTVEVL